MTYRVKINGVVCFVKDGIWTSSDPNYQESLNIWLKIEKALAVSPDSPFFWLDSPVTPDSDYLIATETAKILDGTVMDQPIVTKPTKKDKLLIN